MPRTRDRHAAALRAGRHPALRSIRRRLGCPQPLLCTPKAAWCSASAAIAALRIGFSNSACAPPSTILSVEPGQAARSRLAACYHVFDYAALLLLITIVVIIIIITVVSVVDNAARRYSADRMGSTHGLEAWAGRALRFTNLYL
mmetsp:Transcript_34531/g.115323  ORF Transcript_34531/g.115323 Transcript_34531/m.115323 type:complete len:144 (+) Transcript_34531:272-703(+)